MTFPFVIAVVFSMGDASELMGSPIALLSPYTQIILSSTGNVGAAIVLGLSSTSIAFAAGFDLWGAAARSIWSLARDGALPPMFARVNSRFEVPVESLLVLLPPTVLIAMIYIWNSTAFYGIMAGVLVAFQMSYVIPIALNAFYARSKGKHEEGPWSLGVFGWFVDVVAFCFASFMVVFMSFPVYQPVTAENM
jgi:amino acid transporter